MTERGRSLQPILRALEEWGADYRCEVEGARLNESAPEAGLDCV